MNCFGCPAAAFGCPIGAIGQFFVRGLFPFAAVGLMILAGALIGRMICGWVCPFGFLQDLMHRIRLPFLKKKPGFPGALTWGKYAFLVVTVLWIPLAWGVNRSEEGFAMNDLFFCNVCPAGTLEAAVPVKLKGDGAPVPIEEAEAADPAGEAGGDDWFGDDSGTGAADILESAALGEAEAAVPAGVDVGAGAGTLGEFFLSPRMWILYAFLGLFVLFRRPFCRGVCPIGAVFAVLNRFSFLRMRVKKDACKACNVCAKSCPVENRVFESPGHQDCVKCLECIQTCRRGGVEAGLVGVQRREDYWE